MLLIKVGDKNYTYYMVGNVGTYSFTFQDKIWSPQGRKVKLYCHVIQISINIITRFIQSCMFLCGMTGFYFKIKRCGFILLTHPVYQKTPLIIIIKKITSKKRIILIYKVSHKSTMRCFGKEMSILNRAGFSVKLKKQK